MLTTQSSVALASPSPSCSLHRVMAVIEGSIFTTQGPLLTLEATYRRVPCSSCSVSELLCQHCPLSRSCWPTLHSTVARPSFRDRLSPILWVTCCWTLSLASILSFCSTGLSYRRSRKSCSTRRVTSGFGSSRARVASLGPSPPMALLSIDASPSAKKPHLMLSMGPCSSSTPGA